MSAILIEDTDCCTSEPEEEDLSGDYLCHICKKHSITNPSDTGFGFCRFDPEKQYALHVSDMENFCCREHYPETIMDEEEYSGWNDLIENINKE